MLELMPWFWRGFTIGTAFGFTWHIHKIGKIIMIGLVFISVGIIIFDSNAFIASFRPWQYEVVNVIGLFFGSPIGRWLADEIKS